MENEKLMRMSSSGKKTKAQFKISFLCVLAMREKIQKSKKIKELR